MSNIEADRNATFEPVGSPEDVEDDGEVSLPARTERAPSPSAPPAQRPAALPEVAKPAAQASTVAQQGAGDDAKEPQKSHTRMIALAAVLLALMGAGGYYGYQWWTVGRFLVSTDDAYVKADLSVIATKVTGSIADVPIRENQTIRTGQLLAKIDDRDYVIAVQSSQNKVATQDATIARLKEQAKAQLALIEQSKAQVTSAQAGLVRANADFGRADTLAKTTFGSRQSLDQALAARDQGQAGVEAAKAAQASVQANLAVLEAQVDEAVHVRAELQSALDQANLNLSYTEVRAPFDGVVGNKAVQLGQYVQPGTRLLSLVPLDTVYIEANYKETQLDSIRPGQTADVAVDAAGGRKYQGVVESLAPASGSQFSLLPPENATGNFTKIVQRVPIRIRLSGEALTSGILRPGLSVVTYVHIKDVDGQQTAARDPNRADAVALGSRQNPGSDASLR